MSESIEQAVLSFEKLVLDMSQRRARAAGDDDPESYVHQMLRQIGEDSQAQVATAREALELARDVASKIKRDNEESVEAMIPMLRSCVDAQVMAAGFFSSLPSTLSSDTASLSLGISTLPPIVKAYSSSWEAGVQAEGSEAGRKATAAPPKPKLTVRVSGSGIEDTLRLSCASIAPSNSRSTSQVSPTSHSRRHSTSSRLHNDVQAEDQFPNVRPKRLVVKRIVPGADRRSTSRVGEWANEL